ncbi:MAG: hypothetical protein R6W77_06345 [Trueperaceae bacterium]
MNGNDLLQYDMMLAHQQRLRDEADRLRLAREVGRRAGRGRGAATAATPPGRWPSGAPRRWPAPKHAHEPARRRFGGVAGRIGATLVTFGTRLQRLEGGPDGRT